jgi:hypothetical protein
VAGLNRPTAFAFGGGLMFAADGASEDGKTPGGVFVIQGGAPTRLPSSSPFVSDLGQDGGTDHNRVRDFVLRVTQVVSMPTTGGQVTTLLTGFAAPIVGLATYAGAVYVGEFTGQVFSVRP